MDVSTSIHDILAQRGYDKNLLHFYPLNARLTKVAIEASLDANKYLTHLKWNSRLVSIISTTVYASGAALAIPCAIIENFVSTTFFLLGIALSRATNHQYPIITKLSTKCYAYSCESIFQMTITLSRLVERKIPTHYLEAAVAYQIPHLGAAIIGNILRLIFLDTKNFTRPTETQQQWKDLAPSFLSLISEWIQDALNEVVRAHLRDFGTAANPGTPPQTGLSQQSQDILVREIRNIDLQRLTEQNYLDTVLQKLEPVLQEIQRLFGAYQVNGVTAFGLEVSELKYQEHLVACSKAAIIQLYNSEDLLTYLPDGRDAILGFYAEATPALAHMAQLIEIEKFSEPNGIKCPETFESPQLKPYEARYLELKKLSEKLKQLTPQEKKYLQQKLMIPTEAQQKEIRPTELKHEDEIEALFKGICSLGGQLHQGKLMSVLKIRMSANPVQTENIFVKAWKDAVTDLTKPSPKKPQ